LIVNTRCPTDIVAILTKVVQKQQGILQEQQKSNPEEQTLVRTSMERLA
jgi:hypothetical protein